MPRPAPVDIEIQLQSGVTVAALEFAPAQGCNGGEAERCLALHGWLDSAATFELLVPHLPDDMRIVAIDFTGHGKSSHGPPGTSYSFVDYAVEVLQVANELGWRRFSILGHSMGGVLGGLVAAAHPDRVERLVVIDVLGPVPTQPHRVVHALHRSLAPDAARPPRVFNSLEEAARRKQHGVVEKLPLDAARVLAKRQLKQVEGGYTWTSDPRAARLLPSMSSEAATCAILAAIQCPVLVVAPDDGMLRHFPAHVRTRRALAVRRLEVFCLKRGGHHPHLTQPLEVARGISEWLTRVRAPGAAPGAPARIRRVRWLLGVGVGVLAVGALALARVRR